MTYSMLYTFYYSRRVSKHTCGSICVLTCDICFCSRIIWPFPLEPHFDVSSYDIACCPDFFSFKHLFLYSPCINCLSAHFLLFAAIASSSQFRLRLAAVIQALVLQFSGIFCQMWACVTFQLPISFGCIFLQLLDIKVWASICWGCSSIPQLRVFLPI